MTFEQKSIWIKYYDGTIKLRWSILFEIEKYNCKIILSWTDCKSKLDHQCK